MAQIARNTLESQKENALIQEIDKILHEVDNSDLFDGYLPNACWNDNLFWAGPMKWTNPLHYILNSDFHVHFLPHALCSMLLICD